MKSVIKVMLMCENFVNLVKSYFIRFSFKIAVYKFRKENKKLETIIYSEPLLKRNSKWLRHYTLGKIAEHTKKLSEYVENFILNHKKDEDYIELSLVVRENLLMMYQDLGKTLDEAKKLAIEEERAKMK